MKKILFLLLGLTIAVGASANVDSWRSHHPAKKQRTERSITDRTAKKQSALDRKASHAQKHHAKPQTKAFQGKSTGKLRDGAPVVITEQPAGTLVTYKRTGYFVDSYDRPTAINAEVNIVYGLDGQTVYIQDPVFPPQFNTWVMGTISNDKIHVPLGQYVNADYGVFLAWGTCTATATVDPDDDPYVFTPDANATEVTYTINGNSISMDNTTAGNNGDGAVGLAILMDGDPYFMMEYNAVFTEKENPTVIEEQPEGTVAYYKRSGYYYDYDSNSILPQMGLVTMVYDPDGTTIYIKDLVYSDFSGTWLRGTIEDGKLHVPLGQYAYVAYDNEGNYLYGLFLAWSYVGEAYDDYNDEYYIKFIYEPSVTEVTYTIDGDNLIMDNSYGTPDGMYSSGLGLMWDDEDYGFGTEWNTTFTPTEAPTVIENQPEGDLVSYSRKVQYYDYYYQEMYSSTSDFNVVYASDGQTVYVQDPVGSFILGSWVKGTVNGNKITVPLGQYLYVDDDVRMILVWGTNYDEGKYYILLPDPAVTEVTFTIDDQGNVTIDNSSPGIMGNGAVGLGLMLDDGTESISLEWSVPTLPPPITEQPEGELKTYDRSGYYYYDNFIYEQEGTVNIVYAPDGETVYIQDILCNSGIGTWVRGTIEGGKIHVPMGQTLIRDDESMYGVMLAWGQTYYDYDSESYLFENDPTVTEVTFTINGNTISMDNSSFGPNDDIDGATGLCGIYSDIPIWFAQCDLMTVFTAPEPTPTIIDEQPEGELVTYLRSGYTSDWEGYVYDQMGTANLVYAPDGETVYIQDIIYHGPGTWVKGSIDGNKIHVPLGQAIDYYFDGPPTKFKARSGNRDIQFITLSAGQVVPDPDYEGAFLLDVDPSLTEITFSINGNVISLDNTCLGPNDGIDGAMVIASTAMNYPELFDYCDLLTVFSELPETPTIIDEQPEGELVTYLRGGDGIWSTIKGVKDTKDSRYININGYSINSQFDEVNVVYAPDGQTVYIQDLVFCNQNNRNTWVQGALSADGTQIIVPLDQYVSWDEYYYLGTKLAWGSTSVEAPDPDNEDDEQQVIFTPDTSVTQITLTIHDNYISLDNSQGAKAEDFRSLCEQASHNEIEWEDFQQALVPMYQSTGLAYVTSAGKWTGEINWNTVFTSKHPATLPNPVIEGWYQAEDSYDDTYLIVKVPEYDTEGLPIFEDALSYSIYTDNGQLYTFEAGTYNIEQDMTEITYDTWYNQDWNLYIGYPTFKGTWSETDGFVPFFNWRIGIQFHYTVDGVKNSTGITYIEVYDNPNVTPGDVNGDNEVKINDVTALIDLLLSGDEITASIATDVNGDGRVTIADVTALIDLLLSGN